MNKYLRAYPGLIFGIMAAVGVMKVGALLWQEKLSAWPLLHVLVAPLALAGLALGMGAGHDQLVSLSVARRLVPVGGLLLLAVPFAGIALGLETGVLVAATVGPIGTAMVGPRLGHLGASGGAALLGGSDSSSERVEAG